MKKLVSIIVLSVMILNSVVAVATPLDVTFYKERREVANGLEYISYYGKDNSDNVQNVHILDFTPGKDVSLSVSYGDILKSRKTLTKMISNLKEDGAVAGINGDFFSITDGIPVGVIISDGKLVSASVGNHALGIKEDGSIVVGDPQIQLFLKTVVTVPTVTQESLEEPVTEETLVEENELEESAATEETKELSFEACYNKYPTIYFPFLLDSEYSDKSTLPTVSKAFLLKPSSEIDLSAQSVEFVVEEVLGDVEEVDIPDGMFVLTVPNALPVFNDASYIKEGDVLTLTVAISQVWEGVKTAIGAGDVIVYNSEFVSESVNESHEKYVNTRSAVGIRQDGSLFFVAVDGTKGKGMSFETLAEFMIREGAVTALNLDGGGSTTLAVTLPSNRTTQIKNTLKDGSERAISDAVIFLDNAHESQDVKTVEFNTSDIFLLAGSSMDIEPVYYTGDGQRYEISPENIKYESSEALAQIDGSTYKSADKTYIDEIAATFDFGKYTLEKKTVLNVTDILDTLELNRHKLILLPNTSFDVDFSATRFGRSVTADFSDLTVEVLGEGSEYISIDDTGLLQVANAPMFKSVDVHTSYKDTKDVLTVYFGKLPEILDDFEDGAEALVNRIKNFTKKVVTEGYRSAKAINATDGAVYYSAPVEIAGAPKYFTVLIKDGWKEGLSAIILADGKEIALPYYAYKDYSDITGWCELVALVPDGLEGKIEVVAPIVSSDKSAFTADRFSAFYGWNEKLFADTDGIWSEDYIEQCYDMGLVNGYTVNGSLVFKPDNYITRAEFSKMLSVYLSLDKKEYSEYGGEFADADSIPEWARPYIRAVSSEGYMNGSLASDGTVNFNPQKNITRAEVMKVFSKLITHIKDPSTFEYTDAQTVPEWAEEAVRLVVSAGVVTGYDDGTIRAGNYVTRAQMCVMFSRLWESNNK